MYFAIDINQINIKILGTEDLNNPDFSKIIKLQNTGDYDLELKSIIEFIKARNYDSIKSIVISCISSLLSELENQDYIKEIEEKFQTKVFLKNSEELIQSSNIGEQDEHQILESGFEFLKQN